MQLLSRNIFRSFKHSRKITADTRGAVLLEFAFVLPVFALLLFGVIEFGWYMIRYEAANRALSVATIDATSGTSLSQAMANNLAGGVIPFGNGTSYICAQAYSTSAAAAASPSCANGDWVLAGGSTPICKDTGAACPTGYYVALAAYAQPMSLTGFVDSIIPQGTAIYAPNPSHPVIVQVGSGAGGGSSTLPTCTTAGEVLTWNGTAIVCSDVAGLVTGGCIEQYPTGTSVPGDEHTILVYPWGNATSLGDNWTYGIPGLSNACVCPTNETAEGVGTQMNPISYPSYIASYSGVICLTK